MIVTVLAVEIDLEAGWAVGATDTVLTGVDRELLTDREGNPWVPASSLAGSLRAHLAAHGSDERLMGSRPPEGRADTSLTPSALWLVGTSTTDAENHDPPPTDVVANTAIDPRRRAALPRSLRQSRIVSRPTRIMLYMQHESPEGLAAHERELLGSWLPQVGRDRTRGGGRAALRRITYRTYDLGRDADLRDWLTATGPDRFARLPHEIQVARDTRRPLLSVTFEIADALHVGTGRRRDKVAEILRRDGTPIVPASTWKGLFRARSAYILRTMHGPETACRSQTGCGQCPICELFGSTSRRGLLAFTDSAIVIGRNPARPVARTHVAIDRITGGARDKLLFTQEVIESGRLNLMIHPLQDITDHQHDLLLHVIRDIDDGLIGVGGGAQRGQGTLRLTTKSRTILANLAPVPGPPSTGEAS